MLENLFGSMNNDSEDNYFFRIGLSSLVSDKLSKNYKKSFIYFKDLAEKGDPKAQYYLGEMYKNGKGVEKDEENSKNYFTKSFYTLSGLAEEGDPEAQYYLSLMFYNGYGCKKNLIKSFEWCKKSAEQEYDEAQLNLAKMYENGCIVKEYDNDKKAIEWFEKSAKKGNVDAKYLLANEYSNRNIDEEADKLYKECFTEYKKRAENGGCLAQLKLGIMYYFGKGIEENKIKAFELLCTSAEQGDSEAQSWVGWCYGKAVGVQQDKEKAFEWCKKSAEQGNPKGQSELAELYKFEGDYEKAFYWNLKAAKQGNLWASFSIFSTTPQAIGAREQPSLKTLINSYRLSANFDLEDADFLELLEFAYLALDGGALLSNGQDYDLRGNYFLGESFFYGDFGVHQNYEMAFKWYLKAADLGYGDAQLAIADMYYEGKGTTKDYVKAFEYYSKSAEQGEERAQYNLGVMYLKGEGVKSNKVKAFEYIEKSSENNYKNAKTALDILSKLKESNQDDNIEFFKEISVNPISSRWW